MINVVASYAIYIYIYINIYILILNVGILQRNGQHCIRLLRAL